MLQATLCELFNPKIKLPAFNYQLLTEKPIKTLFSEPFPNRPVSLALPVLQILFDVVIPVYFLLLLHHQSTNPPPLDGNIWG